MSADVQLALESKAWPFIEAQKVVERMEKRLQQNKAVGVDAAGADKDYALFETGYGPSGLPHIGTFGEVARTSMVRHAFTLLSDIPTRLFAFSDDMDGFRKVPDNIPNREMMVEFIDHPLTSVPDPFGEYESFGHHNNARLQAFLDQFGFDYEFVSATECYGSGRFDQTLLKLLANYDKVMDIILPTLGAERQATYSPFLPLSAKSGKVLQVPMLEVNVDAGTIVFEDEGEKVELPVTGGNCKLQWKADWAMRWAAFEVDYEMAGKDLIDSVRLSSRICQVLGGTPPENFSYELFLDENGEKISKSRGNGLTIEEWLRYAAPESLAYYMYQSPRKAKRLYFDVIPRAVDDYLTHLGKFGDLEAEKTFASPVWHVHLGNPPPPSVDGISFAILLNLVSASHSEDAAVLWGFISRYLPDATPQNHPQLDGLVHHAINYFHDFIKPNKTYRLATSEEKVALEDLVSALEAVPDDVEEAASALQTEIFEVGKRHDYENLRDWFRCLYEVLLGESQGPRMGSFIALYGKQETIALIRRALAGEDLASED